MKGANLSEDKRDKNEVGTPDWVLDWVQEDIIGAKFDLDVAASDAHHVCDAYYTKDLNALTEPWHGHVWCNPPFDNIPKFVEKAWSEWAEGNCKSICMLIPANRTEQPFWQEHIEQARDKNGSDLTTHFVNGRVKFKGFKGSPPFGCVLLVWK